MRRLLLFSPAAVLLAVWWSASAKGSEEFECKHPYFRCGNSSVCVEQQYWCDDIPHCPNGEDEIYEDCNSKNQHPLLDILTADALCYISITVFNPSVMIHQTGFWTEFSKILGANNKQNDSEECRLDTFPPVCLCKMTWLECSQNNLTSIPPGIPNTTTKIFLHDNLISGFPVDAFRSFPNLEWIHIEDNEITQIQPGTFGGLKKLSKISLGNNHLTHLDMITSSAMPALRWLFIGNNWIETIALDTFNNLDNLHWLDLHSNRLTFKETDMLRLPRSVKWLDLEDNRITEITDLLFNNTTGLTVLILRRNYIRHLDVGAFKHMLHLKELDLSANEITHLPGLIFQHNTRLFTLFLGENPLTTLPLNAFVGLNLLDMMNLTDLTIDNIDREMFAPMKQPRFIVFKSFQYCHYAPHVRSCEPKGDGLSSFENLLDMRILRVCIWVVAILTCCGNFFVMVGRYFVKEDNRSHSFLIRNLCAADLLMGVYLFIVAAQDIKFRDHYNKFAYEWMHSWGCQATGITAMMSSEVSVMILTYMSLERYFIIAHPYRLWKATWKQTGICLAIIWSCGILISTLPLFAGDSLDNFYGANGVCFPLHIHEPFLPGWQYSAAIFLGINFFAMLIIAFSYLGMFYHIVRTRKMIRASLSHDTAIARRFFWIVLTDALCWIPIIVIKLLAFAKIRISDESYAWITIFILPINSALNPLLYTLNTTHFKRQMRVLLHLRPKSARAIQRFPRNGTSWKSTASRKSSAGSGQVYTSFTNTDMEAAVNASLLQSSTGGHQGHHDLSHRPSIHGLLVKDKPQRKLDTRVILRAQVGRGNHRTDSKVDI